MPRSKGDEDNCPPAPLGPPSTSKSGTGTLMVLFTPSPRSFYRVEEFSDLDKAKQWCEGFAAVPSEQVYVRLVVCSAVNWQEFSAWTGSAPNNRNRAHKYMVLWKDMEPCYHEMCEFEQLQDAVQYAFVTRARLQELRAVYSHGLPETLRVFAFTLVGEWNVANKPRA
jgi:hypothetical protein